MKTSKRINERTPSGGVYSITYFKDKEGRPCEEQQAVHFEVVEYDEQDNPINRTYC
jgi:hypothetical protein